MTRESGRTTEWALPVRGATVGRCIIDVAFSIHLHDDACFRLQAPFTYTAPDGVEHTVDPRGDPTATRPALALARREARAALASSDGRLELTFDDGSSVRVPPGSDIDAWTVVGRDESSLVSRRGGGLAVWRPRHAGGPARRPWDDVARHQRTDRSQPIPTGLTAGVYDDVARFVRDLAPPPVAPAVSPRWNLAREARRMWRELVPAEGQADTVQGELLRSVATPQDEAQRNDDAHWGPGHERLLGHLEQRLVEEETFTVQQREQAWRDLALVADHERPVVNDDLWERLRDAVVLWSRQQTALVPYGHLPELEARRLFGTGVEPAITGEPPEERR